MLRKKIETVALLAAALAGVLVGTPVTKAASIQVTGVKTTLKAGVWDYAYTMALTANTSLSATTPAGSCMFIFFDVSSLTGQRASFTAGSTPASAWNIVPEYTSGIWANGQSTIVSQGGTAVATDLASMMNVRFQYVGSGFSAGSKTSTIGTAHLYSTAPPGLYGQFAGRWIGVSSKTGVSTQSLLMPTAVGGAEPAASLLAPEDPVPAGTVVPLPAAVWMGLSSLLGLAFFSRARRRAQR